MSETCNDKKLSLKQLRRVFFRSFALQGSWNFEGLQGLGFLYVIAPALRFLYNDEARKAAFERHLGYFNTHPFLASPIVGSVLHLEESRANGMETVVDVQDYKAMTMAPYAAMGDALFWGGIRPLAAGIALFFAAKDSLWAPVVFLVLFNAPHVWIRCFGFFHGYLCGVRATEAIQRRRLPDLAIRIKEGTVVLLGVLCAYLTFLSLKGDTLSTGWGFAALPLVLLSGWLTRKGVSALLLVILASALSVLLLHLV